MNNRGLSPIVPSRKIAGSQATVYHYDLTGNLLAETDANGNLIRDYLWVDSTPIVQVDAGEKLAYLHTDHLNTPRLATNPQGQVVWRWEGTAFGETYPNEDVDGNGIKTMINLRFPGQYYDAETGLHYNWNRYYDPKLGRYVTSDPIGLAGGINTYTYVENNPLRYTDPLGLVWEYNSGSGELWHFPPGGGAATYIGRGYSGYGNGYNNPNYELCRKDVPNCSGDAGPIPEGDYDIGSPYASPLGNPTLRLTPRSPRQMHGRGGFLIHGDDSCNCGTGSWGCIILNKKIREQIGASGDPDLRVVR